MRPNLTLNLGVRYEYDQPIYEVNNKQANVNFSNQQLMLAGVNGNSRALYNPSYNNIMPRLGFSYNPTPRFVVRGGYGLTTFMEGTGANLRLNYNPPFQVSFLAVLHLPRQVPVSFIRPREDLPAPRPVPVVLRTALGT